MADQKLCKHCGIEKPLTMFYRDVTRSDGHRSRCNCCQSAAAKARYASYRKTHPTASQQARAHRSELYQLGKKQCTDCGNEKHLSCFYRNSDRLDGYLRVCKVCYKSRYVRKDPRQKIWMTQRSLREVDKKQCLKCSQIKSLSEFRAVAKNRDGFCNHCKTCTSAATRDWKEKNPDYVAPKKYRHNPVVRRAYENNKLKTDSAFKFHKVMRLQIWAAAGGKKSETTEEALGCTTSEFQEHLKSLLLPGMTLENHGPVWHIGHRKPCAMIDSDDPEQRKECFHYTNLFPQYVKDNLAAGAKYEGIDFRGLKASQYAIIPIALAQAKELVEQYHYAGSSPSAATRCYGLTKKDAPETLLGAAVFRPAPIGAAKAQCPEDPQKVLCLSRLVVVPGVPQNAATYFLARCLRQLGQEKKWTLVVTYADTWQQHEGNIYKASNWEYLGLTAPQPVWTLNGKLISQRGRGKGRRLANDELDAMGAVFHGKFSKHVYRYVLRE